MFTFDFFLGIIVGRDCILSGRMVAENISFGLGSGLIALTHHLGVTYG